MNNPFIEYQCVSITICDTEAIVVYQNDISKKTFGSVVGRSLFDCHPPKAAEKIRHLLANDGTNAYTISKKGLKKLIYQTTWKNERADTGTYRVFYGYPRRDAALCKNINL